MERQSQVNSVVFSDEHYTNRLAWKAYDKTAVYSIEDGRCLTLNDRELLYTIITRLNDEFVLFIDGVVLNYSRKNSLTKSLVDIYSYSWLSGFPYLVAIIFHLNTQSYSMILLHYPRFPILY